MFFSRDWILNIFVVCVLGATITYLDDTVFRSGEAADTMAFRPSSVSEDGEVLWRELIPEVWCLVFRG